MFLVSAGVAAATLIAIGGAVIYYVDELVPVGGVLIGVGLTLVATYGLEELKRWRLRSDFAYALYSELAYPVARCCFDLEDPWRTHWSGPKPEGMSAFTSGKGV